MGDVSKNTLATKVVYDPRARSRIATDCSETIEEPTNASISSESPPELDDGSHPSRGPRRGLHKLCSVLSDPGRLINRSTADDECLGTWSATGILVNFISVGYILNPSGKACLAQYLSCLLPIK